MRKVPAAVIAVATLTVLAGLLLAHIPGRMTGGGSVFTTSGVRVTHGFELHCRVEGPNGATSIPTPNNLEINWEGNRFHMETLDQAFCLDDANIAPQPPNAPFDTFIGHGLGRYNGVPGYNVWFQFTDAGEPGTSDTAFIHILDPDNINEVLKVETNFLTFGNHQAHKANP